jgi:hypothetical protein
METTNSFHSRIEETTGKRYEELQHLTEMPAYGGHVFCARGEELVVGVGYPDKNEETGEEVWTEFAVVHTNPSKIPWGSLPPVQMWQAILTKYNYGHSWSGLVEDPPVTAEDEDKARQLAEPVVHEERNYRMAFLWMAALSVLRGEDVSLERLTADSDPDPRVRVVVHDYSEEGDGCLGLDVKAGRYEWATAMREAASRPERPETGWIPGPFEAAAKACGYGPRR